VFCITVWDKKCISSVNYLCVAICLSYLNISKVELSFTKLAFRLSSYASKLRNSLTTWKVPIAIF
jgi:hypothetical protein